MGRKVLLAVVCWLTLSGAIGEAETTVDSSVADNESAESAPRLYKTLPHGVYASAAPYASYSFAVPAVSRAPKSAVSYRGPVQAASVIVPNTGLYRDLKDSYGKYVESPQMAAFRAAFPQQFVPLQDLPPHLAQPLASASPSFQFQTSPNYFFGPQSYKVPALQLGPAPTPLTHFGSISQPMVYAEDLKHFAPSASSHATVPKVSAAPQTSTTKEHYVKAPVTQRTKQKQRANGVPSKDSKDTKHQASHNQKGQIQAAPAQTSVTAIVNGKKTVFNLNTKPPVPLLDINLLEPLTFDNPLVSQMQHFLPKIHSATYHKLPSYNVKGDDSKKKHKEVAIFKSYDTGYVKEKPAAPKKKQSKPGLENKPTSKPGIVVKGYPNSGDYSYEINTPNHKESYNEQVVKYNKETNMKPVEYTYNEQTHKEPEVYSFVHSAKEPLKVTHVEYSSDDEKPNNLVYNLSPEEQEEGSLEDERQPSSQESEYSGESSAESEEEGAGHHPHYEEAPKQHKQAPHYSQNYDSPKQQYSHYYTQSYTPKKQHSNSHSENHGTPKPHHHSEHRDSPQQHHSYNENQHSSKRTHSKEHKGHHDSPQHSNHQSRTGTPKQKHHDSKHQNKFPNYPSSQQHSTGHTGQAPGSPQQQYIFHGQIPKQYYAPVNFQINNEGPLMPAPFHSGFQVHSLPRQSHLLKVEHRGQQYQQQPQQLQIVQGTPQYYSQAVTLDAYQPITPEYNQDIRLLPTHAPHAPHAEALKVDPNQHIQIGPSLQHRFNAHPSPAPQQIAARNEKHLAVSPTPIPFTPTMHIEEKSKQVIIKEQEETPDERHIHTEQAAGEMVKREENDEEDFEKAYKESAFGFPAYEKAAAEAIEQDIYDPESYAVPQFHNDYKIEDSPFKQYQQDGDKFPKSSRLAYKDARDSNMEDYFFELAVNKPESYTDRVKNKIDYYKMFKNNRPGKSFYVADEDDDDESNEKKSEKLTAAPSYDYYGSSSSKPKEKQDNFFAKYRAEPIKYEYDYSKEMPKDSISYASHPYHKYKRTHFVEPQFQYGFEPISAPIVAESELAASASNNNPESEKPGNRKKLYKENWYIKKTTTTGSKPS